MESASYDNPQSSIVKRQSTIPNSQSVYLIRPLLFTRRADIERYALAAGLTWRHDSTNADTRYSRNFLRHKLLPAIREKLSPRAEDALLGLADHAAEIDAFLTACATELLTKAAVAPDSTAQTAARSPSCLAVYDTATLRAADPAVQGYAIRQLLELAGLPMRDVGRQQIAAVRDMLAPDGLRCLSLGGSFTAGREGDTLVLAVTTSRQSPADSAATSSPFEVPLNLDGFTRLPDGYEIFTHVEELQKGTVSIFENNLENRDSPQLQSAAFASHAELLDADQLRPPLIARPRRNGDVFHPLGAPGTKTVSDFLTDLKLPHHFRRCVVCICDGRGIVALWPLRIDNRVRVTSSTMRVLRISSLSRVRAYRC